MITIYKITNIITGKQYVGQTRKLSSRIRQYKSDYHTRTSLLAKAMQTDGFDNFIFNSIVETEYPDEFELYFAWRFRTLTPHGYNENFIFKVKRGYNKPVSCIKHLSEIRFGENNPMYGKHHTPETKAKITESLLKSTLCKDILLIQYSTNKIIYEFHNRTEAEKHTGIKKGTIWSRLHHKIIINDTLWIYKNEYVMQGVETIENTSLDGSK